MTVHPTAELTVDLGALVANYRLLQRHAKPARTAAAVKADAYGTGAEQAGPALFKAGCRQFFVAILSGTGSVAAPFIGAVLLELLRNFAYAHAPNTWQLVVGSVMLLVILFLPEGLWSLFRRRRPGTA